LILTAIFAAFTVTARASVAPTITAIPTPVATATITTTTGTGRAIFTRPGFIHCHGATVHFLAIERLDGGFGGFLGFHGHKAKTARPTAKFIHDDVRFNHPAMCGEKILKLILSCVEGKISDKQFGVH